MEWQHVYPVNDLKPHDTDTPFNCECEPEIDWANHIVIHNAWDLREVDEYLKGSKNNQE